MASDSQPHPGQPAANDATGGEADDRDTSLAELKSLLADEGVAADDGATAEQALTGIEGEPAAEGAPEPPGRRRRAGRRGERSRRARNEQVFRDLDAQLSAEPLEVRIDDDHATVTISRVGPENTLAEIQEQLRRHKVRSGIDGKAIAAALRQAANGTPQYDVVVARGRAFVVHDPPTLRQHLPRELHVQDPLPLESLHQALSGPSLDVVENWSGLAHVVHKGDVLLDVAPARYEPGEDVFGGRLEPELANPPLPHGEHTHLSEDGRAVRASLYGFAGVLDGEPTVIAPLWVAPDGMDVRFVCVDAGSMPAPTEEEFAEILQARWVEHGVLPEAVASLRQRLGSGEPLPRTVTVARGTPPTPGEDGRLEHVYPPDELLRWADLQAALQAKDLEGLAAGLSALVRGGRRVVAVHAGELLVRRVPASVGVDGRDVRGEEIAATEGKDVALDVGANIEVDGDALQATAAVFGLLAVHGTQLNVVAPLWLSADRMTACFINLPGTAPPSCVATEEELTRVVDRDRRLTGLDLSAWPDLRRRLESGELTGLIIPVAQGTPPQAGRDGTFEWAVTVGGRSGRILEDGSIDLRDRAVVSVVEKGALLGRLQPSGPGAPGRDALGREMAPAAVTDLEVVTDAHVEARQADDGAIAYYAAMEGGVSCTEETRRSRGRVQRRMRIGLFAVSEIERDVDYTTGHIDFSGDVIVRGSVKPLFRVRATGSVTIGGTVEPGAVVCAGGDLTVAGGVIGQSTRLEAGGSVMAKFVQEASVRAGGNVEVGAYVFDAAVRAGGTVSVAGKGAGDRALVGGLVWAGEGIEVPSLGSPSNPRIRVVVGVDPGVAAQSERVRDTLRRCEARQQQELVRLGARRLDTAFLQRKAQAATPRDRPAVLAHLKGIAELGLLQQDLRRRLEESAAAQRELAQHASLSVAGPIFAGVELRVGEQVLRLTADMSKMRFRLAEDEDGQLSIQSDPL